MRSMLPSSAIKTTVFTFTTVILFGVLAIAVGNLTLTPSHSYSGLFTDATGVQKGSPVRVAGVDVGRITNTKLHTDGPRRLARVTFTVERDVPIYQAAELELRYENLLGGRYLAIVERPSETVAPAGSTFPVTQTRPALNLTALFNGFQPLFTALNPSQVNALSIRIVRTLQGEGGTIRDLLAQTAALTSSLADRDAVIGRVVNNLSQVLTTLDSRDTSVTQLIQGFTKLMTGLASNKDTISSALPDVAQLLDVSGTFLQDLRAPLHDDVLALGSLAGNVASSKDVLDQVLQRMSDRVNTMTRLGTYGSWFNYLLCGAEANVSVGNQTLSLATPSLQANASDTACSGGTR